jgi:uncharacterized membrane protein YccC
MSNSETHIQAVEHPPAAPPAATPVQVSPPAGPDLVTLVMVALGVVAVAALYLAREVLIPITLAILLSFVLGPVVSLFRRLHLPRVPAVLLAVILALCILRMPVAGPARATRPRRRASGRSPTAASPRSTI